MCHADRHLIRNILAGDQVAANEFVQRWHRQITAWVNQRANQNLVEDYVQEVWIHLAENGWSRLAQWQGLYDDTENPNSLGAFLKTVTRYKVIDLHRMGGQPSRLRLTTL